MKICQIAYSGFGGHGSVVFSLITADSSHIHDWSVGFVGDQDLNSEYHERCVSLNIEYRAFKLAPGYSYTSWLPLFAWLSKIKPDVVVCHSISSILACRWYASIYGAGLVAVEHTPNKIKVPSEWLASRLSMLLADRIVVLTSEYYEELRGAHGWMFKQDKVCIISNGIDTLHFLPRSDDLMHAGLIRLGMAARFSVSKRQDLLVGLMSKLNDLRPDLSFELRLAGDGSEMLRVQSLCQVSPIALQIHFDGLLNEHQLVEWFHTLDIYVHATDGETLSTSLLQAMSAGLPIVASAIPGVSNLLGTNGEYGLCATNDVEAFAKSIITCIDSDLLRNELGARARARVLSHYSNNVMLKRYLDLISECH